MSPLRRHQHVLNNHKTLPARGEQIITGPITGFEKNNSMDFFEGLFELPGALFRKLFTARDKTFDQILKDYTKNKLIGLCVVFTLFTIIILLILTV